VDKGERSRVSFYIKCMKESHSLTLSAIVDVLKSLPSIMKNMGFILMTLSAPEKNPSRQLSLVR